jgi:flagellar M-ring protein FliF
MSVPRRVALVVLTACSIAAIVGVGIWSSQPDYRTIYSGLSAEDAGAITSKLQAQGVKFRLTSGGTTVQVPSEQLEQLRIELAVDGLPAKGGKGFEIFDDAPLGMTPFTQHINYSRALQTELAKSIMHLEPVSQARVHIVQPEPSAFIRDQKPTTASVVLWLKPGATLSRSMSNGIVALVSHAVEGLTPDNVTLLDGTGHVLSEPRSAEGGDVPGSQLEYRHQLEADLAAKAEDMLGKMLGSGRAVVRVTAELNFKRTKEKRETYKPEERVIRTEKVTNTKSGGASANARVPVGAVGNAARAPAPTPGPTTSNQEEMIENEYAISKTTQEIEDGVGSIERLSIAAMVDLKGESAEGESTAPALTVKDAEEIVKQAVGFKTGRDAIKVTDVRLPGAPTPNESDAELVRLQRWQTYVNLVRNASLGLVALVGLVLGTMFLRRLRGFFPTEPPPQETQQLRIIENLTSLSERDPAQVARLLSAWLDAPQETVRRAA